MSLNNLAISRRVNYNMELSFIDIYMKLANRRFLIPTEKLLSSLISTCNLTEYLIEKYLDNESNLFERNDYYGQINPIAWEIGHILFFWEHLVCKNLGYDNFYTDPELYDSFKISRERRFASKKKINITSILTAYKNLKEYVMNYIEKYKITTTSCYLIRLGQLHQDMHNESLIFSAQVLGYNLFSQPISYHMENNLSTIETISVSGGGFIQGVSEFTSDFYFDNESPEFYQVVKPFKISKYCITNYQYLQFVLAGGYENKDYWIDEGWYFLKEKKLSHPINWKKINNVYFERIGNDFIILRNNHPVINISWYEAMAFCKWKNVRLMYEHEWEYIVKLTKTKVDNNVHCNYGLNYNKTGTISVLEDKSENRLGIVGMYGNCWQWCMEPFHPYDGFKIDPVYREMSYPFFGQRRIVRGSSWATPYHLVNSHYRNSQPPSCLYQIIGFRIVY
jgi:iron(II)-dependent oxidoreductase